MRYVYGPFASDNTIIGPTTLFPGLTTPVKPGEDIYRSDGLPAEEIGINEEEMRHPRLNG